MSGYVVGYRPVPLSSLASVGFAVGVVAFLVQLDGVWLALGILTGGVVLVGAGVWVGDRTDPVIKAALVMAGILVIGGAFAVLVSQAHRPSLMLLVLSGMTGVSLLGFGVFPVYGSGSRFLVKSGTALVFVSVLLAGLFHSPVDVLLVAGVLTVLAWDAGENAINIGEHLGSRAATKPIEAVHLTGSLVVGGLAVLTGLAVGTIGPLDLSLVQFALLIFAAVLLVFALHD